MPVQRAVVIRSKPCQVRNFKITAIDPIQKKIEVEVVAPAAS